MCQRLWVMFLLTLSSHAVLRAVKCQIPARQGFHILLCCFLVSGGSRTGIVGLLWSQHLLSFHPLKPCFCLQENGFLGAAAVTTPLDPLPIPFTEQMDIVHYMVHVWGYLFT